MNEICSARNVSGMIAKFENDAFPNAVVSNCIRFCARSEFEQPNEKDKVNVPVLPCTAATSTLHEWST